MLFAAGRIMGRGQHHAPRTLYRRGNPLIPDYQKTRAMRAEIEQHRVMLEHALDQYMPGVKFPHVVLAESTTLDEPLGEAFPGFNMILIKDWSAYPRQEAELYTHWVMAHEFGHILLINASFNAFFRSHPDLKRQREAFITSVITLEIDHRVFSSGLRRQFKHSMQGTLPLEDIHRAWALMRQRSPHMPFSLIENPYELSKNQRKIFTTYILLTLFDLAQKRATLMLGPDLCEAVCNYIACVVTNMSLEEFFESPLSFESEKAPGSPSRIRLSHLAHNFPPPRIGRLLFFFANGETRKIISPP